MPLSPEALTQAYRRMKTIREFEARISREFEAGTVPGFTHLYLGQEAVAAGICFPLTDADSISSTHRGHGHCIAKGCDVRKMALELWCKRDGLCKGKGGSMHIADLDRRMLGANGIVGGGMGLATGAALTAKLQGTGAVAVCFSLPSFTMNTSAETTLSALPGFTTRARQINFSPTAGDMKLSEKPAVSGLRPSLHIVPAAIVVALSTR